MIKKKFLNRRIPTERNERFFWADVIRVLAIFLVVLDHNNFISQNTSIGNQITGYVLSSVARIGVPLFVMLSGSLLLTRQTSYRYFFKRRIIKVLIPWIAWAVIYTLWFVLTRDTTTGMGDVIRIFYQTFFGQFWYLWMLWGLYLLTPILWRFLKTASSKDVLYAIGLWFVFTSLLPFLYHLYSPYSPVSQNYIFLHLGFYVLGYYFLIQKINTAKNVLLTVSISCVLIQSVGLWYLFSFTPPIGFLNTNNSIFIVFATIALFVLLYQSLRNKKYEPTKNTHNVLRFLSGASFFVFLSHGIIMEIFRSMKVLLPIQDSNVFIFSIGMNTFLVISCSLLIYVVVRHIPVARTLFAATNND